MSSICLNLYVPTFISLHTSEWPYDERLGYFPKVDLILRNALILHYVSDYIQNEHSKSFIEKSMKKPVDIGFSLQFHLYLTSYILLFSILLNYNPMSGGMML